MNKTCATCGGQRHGRFDQWCETCKVAALKRRWRLSRRPDDLWVSYVSDGEHGAVLPLSELVQNFRDNDVDPIYDETWFLDQIARRGTAIGYHDFGRFVVTRAP